MHLLMGKSGERLFKSRIKRICIEREDIPHIDHALELATAAEKGGIINQRPPKSLNVVLYVEIECLCVGIRHLKIEIREDDEEVIVVLVCPEELLCYGLAGYAVHRTVGIHGIIVPCRLHHRHIAVVTEGFGGEILGRRYRHKKETWAQIYADQRRQKQGRKDTPSFQS